MGRKLTRVDINGTLFETDAYREVLRQKDNPENKIPFQVFDQEGDGYRLLYDPISKNVPASKKEVLAEPERYFWVLLPALMELDPEGIAMRYEIPMEILCPEGTDHIPAEITAVIKPLNIVQKNKRSQK